jgi:hypothetical protein
VSAQEAGTLCWIRNFPVLKVAGVGKQSQSPHPNVEKRDVRMGHPATNLAGPELYSSGDLPPGTTGSDTDFSTPTVFQGRVYVGTTTEVNVFGLCTSCPH